LTGSLSREGRLLKAGYAFWTDHGHRRNRMAMTSSNRSQSPSL